MNKTLCCESCTYYERKEGCDGSELSCNEFYCRLSDSIGFKYEMPCSHFIEDARHYRERTEVKKHVKVKKFKIRKSIKDIE